MAGSKFPQSSPYGLRSISKASITQAVFAPYSVMDETILPQTMSIIQHSQSPFLPPENSQVKSMEIYAQWTGTKDDPVDVSINFTIEARPASRLRLIKSSDPLLLSHTVRWIHRISEVKHRATSSVHEKHETHLKELSGDTLTPEDAQEFLRALDKDDDEQCSGRDCNDPIRSKPCRVDLELRGISQFSKDRSHRIPESRVSSTTSTEGRSEYGSTTDRQPRYAVSKYYGNRPLLTARMAQSTPDNLRSKSLELSGGPEPPTPDYRSESYVVFKSQSQGDLRQRGSQTSPATSPRLWLNRSSSRQYYRDQASDVIQSLKQLSGEFSEKDTSGSSSISSSNQSQTIPDHVIPTRCLGPSTVILDGALFAHFPDQVDPGIYVFIINVTVSLAEPDALGWREFLIPELLTEASSDVAGTLNFVLVPSPESSTAAVPVQFDFRGCTVVGEVQNGELKAIFPIRQRLSLGVRTQVELHHIQRWNCKAITCSTLDCHHGPGIRFKHDTSLSVINAGNEFFAQRVSFKVIIRNGPQQGGTFRLGPGECLIELPDSQHRAMDPKHSVELVVERDSQDLDKRIRFVFTSHCSEATKVSVPMPVVSTPLGELLSQKIWLLKPSPPLVLHAVLKDFLSIWKHTKRRIGKLEVLCFDRMNTSSLFPDAMDDAIVQVHHLKHPVSFLGLEESHNYTMIEKITDVIASMVINLDIVPGDRLECRLAFDLHVGLNQSLMKMDAAGWHFKHAMINGRLCTKEAAQWWEEDSVTQLLKDDKMVPGEILHLDLSFQMMEQMRDSEGNPIRIIYCLPAFLDKVILGGSLTVTFNASVSLSNVDRNISHYEDLRFRNHQGENCKRLPILGQGYSIEVDFESADCLALKPMTGKRPSTKAQKIRFSGGLPLQPRKLRFDDEESISSDGYDHIDSDIDADSGSGDEDGGFGYPDMDEEVSIQRVQGSSLMGQQHSDGTQSSSGSSDDTTLEDDGPEIASMDLRTAFLELLQVVVSMAMSLISLLRALVLFSIEHWPMVILWGVTVLWVKSFVSEGGPNLQLSRSAAPADAVLDNVTVVVTERIVLEAVGHNNSYVGWRDRLDLALGWRRGPVFFVDPLILMRVIKMEAQRRIAWLIAEKSMKRRFIGIAASLLGPVTVGRALDSTKPGSGKIYLPDPSGDPLLIRGVGTSFEKETEIGGLLVLPTVNGLAANTEIAEIQGPEEIRLKKAFKESHAMEQLTGRKDIVENGDLANGDVQKAVEGFEGTSYKTAPKVDQSHVYNACFERLNGGGCIGIFPEGGSHDRTELLPLKPGVATIALGSLATHPESGLKIIPCGMNYFHAHKFRSRAVVEFGSPVEVPKELVDLYISGDKREAIGQLLETIYQALVAVTVTSPDYDTLMLIQAARRLYNPTGKKLPLPMIVELNRRLVKGYTHYKDDPRIVNLKKSVNDYNKQLWLLGVRDHQVEYAKFSGPKVVFTLLYRVSKLSIMALGTIPGLVLFAPVFIATKFISIRKSRQALAASTVKLEGKDVMATWKLLVALAVAPLLYAVYTGLLTYWTYRNRIQGYLPTWVPLYLVVIFGLVFFPTITFAALRFGETGMDILKSIRPLMLSLNPTSANTLVKLRKKRAELSAEVTDLINTLGPEMFPDFDAARIIADPFRSGSTEEPRTPRTPRTPSRRSTSDDIATTTKDTSSSGNNLPRNESFHNLGSIALFASRPQTPKANHSRHPSSGTGEGGFPVQAFSTLDSKESLEEVSLKIRGAMRERGKRRRKSSQEGSSEGGWGEGLTMTPRTEDGGGSDGR
ncbi:MAG: hypothetical protein Q9220_004747 [cf. Caloplaca sp. 1 TL-2023]